MSRYHFDTVIFDLDGVVTKTALVHAQAWKSAFDEYLRLREKRDSEPFREFTHESDYLPYVDGKPRYLGVKSFLESRGINIPFGEPSDSTDKETVCGIGNKKNKLFNDMLKSQGAEVYPSSVDFIKALKKSGIKIGVASSSKNCQSILQSVGIEDLFQTRVDGVVSVELGLKGKPEGDIFVTATRNLGGVPAKAVVVEDATSGVQAGRNGGFGLVLGIARENNEAELYKNGADIVVSDLCEINIEQIEEWFHKKPIPLFKSWDRLDESSIELIKNKSSKSKIIVNPCYARTGKSALLSGERIVFFLDYDGTLTPIVDRPDLAIMSQDMRDVVKKVSEKYTVAIVSGRMREDVEKLVDIKGLFYAGSHGFDILGPKFSMVEPRVKEIIPLISQIITQLKKEFGNIPGVLIEEKKFSTAVHYRLVEEQFLPKIKQAVDNIIKDHKKVRLMSGKKVFEILPNIDWDKGKAIKWIIDSLDISWSKTTIVYIGDDVTDEYAFRAIRTRGVGILVSDTTKESSADFQLSSPKEVRELFEKLITSS